MLKLIVFTVLLALAKPEGLEEFEGHWTITKVYPVLPITQQCSTFTIKQTNEYCKCGDDKRVPVIELSGDNNVFVKVPAIVIESQEDLEPALEKTCSCKTSQEVPNHAVFRSLSENYFLAYTREVQTAMAVLIAKTVPSGKELEEFEQHHDVLEDESGTLLCSKELEYKKKTSSADTTGNTTHWFNWRPTQDKTETTN